MWKHPLPVSPSSFKVIQKVSLDPNNGHMANSWLFQQLAIRLCSVRSVATLCRLFFITFCIQNINVWMKWSQKGLLSLRSPFCRGWTGEQNPPHIPSVEFYRSCMTLFFHASHAFLYFSYPCLWDIFPVCWFVAYMQPPFFSYFPRHDVCINFRSCKIEKK